MKKKTLSLALALAMCLSLTAPAFAEDNPIPVEEGIKNISITADIGELSIDDLDVEESWTMVDYDFDEETGDVFEVREEVEAYEAIKRDTKFTVKHTGTVDDGTTIEIYVTPYVKLDGLAPQQLPDPRGRLCHRYDGPGRIRRAGGAESRGVRLLYPPLQLV